MRLEELPLLYNNASSTTIALPCREKKSASTASVPTVSGVTTEMPQQSKIGMTSWPGLPYVLDGILCLFGVISLGFLIGLTEEFYHHGAAGNDRQKQLAPVLGFVAFAQGCELADRVWRMCCTSVTSSDAGKANITSKGEGLSVVVRCGCFEADDQECFADDERSPQGLCLGDENQVDRHEGRQAPAWGRYRCELPLQSVKRGRGEYRIGKVRQLSSVAVIEDLDLTPEASEFDRRVISADGAYEADCDSDSDSEGHLIAAERPGWVVVDECDSDGLCLWDEA